MSETFTIKLDYDMREKIFKAMLLEDWEMLNNDIRSYKAKKKSCGLTEIEREDYKAWKVYRKGVKRMIRWHWWTPEANKIIKGKGQYVCTESDY